MANNQVKITGGSLDGSELTNAASEVTLAALLATMKTMARQSGPNSKKAAKELDDFTKSTKAAGDEIDDLSSSARTLKGDLASLTSNGFRILQQGIVGFASGLDNAANNLINFGADLIQSQPEITDFTSSLVNSRLNVLGLGTAVHRLTELMMGNYRSFQTLSQSGIFLGDRISSLQSDFASLGVDARTLTSSLVNSAENFSRFGSASQGATLALRGIRSISASTREELLRFGINFEEQSELFTRGFSRNAVALRRGTVSQNQVTEMSARYAKDLKRISELTGASADQLEDAARKAEAQTAFAIHLDRMRAEGMGSEADALMSQVQMLYANGLDGMAEAFMGKQLNLPTLTDAATSAQGFVVGLNDAMSQLESLAYAGLSEEDLAKERARILKGLQNINSGIDLGSAALIAQADSGMQEVLRLNQMMQFFDSNSSSLAGNMDAAGQTIMSLESALVVVRKGFSDLATAFFGNSTVQNGLTSFTNWISSFTTSVEEFNLTEFWEKYNPFNAEGRANMLDSFRSFWNGPDATALRDTISSFFEFLVEELILGINNTTGLFGGSARGIREERTLGSITETDTTAAVNPTTADLTESQSVYRNMLDQAVELQRNINTFQPMTGEGDVFGEAQRLVDEYQLQLDQLLEKLPSGAETDIESRALIEEYNRQMEISQDRMWRFLSTRETAAAEAANIANRLLERGIEVDTERRIGTLQATGFRSEPKDTVAQIHAGERVLNPEETNEYNNRSNQNNQRPMLEKLDQLNSTMMTVASLLTQELSIQTRTMNRISGLGPDLMKGMP